MTKTLRSSSPLSAAALSREQEQADACFWGQGLAQLGVGIMVYERGGRLLYHAPLVCDLLGANDAKRLCQSGQSGLMAYLYDHAVPDPDGALRLQLARGTWRPPATLFSEVIRTPLDRLLQVQMVDLDAKRLLVVVEDVNDALAHTREQEDLSWQHYALLQAIEHGETGFMIFDPSLPHRPIQFANQAFCRMIGKTRDELLGKDWRPLLPDVKTPQSYCVVPMSDDRGGGSGRVFGCQYSLLNDLGIIVMADITDLHEKEEHIRRISRLDSLGQLAGGIAHDFNNILGIIQGYAHILGNLVRQENGSVEAPVQSILRACERGAALTDKLLTFGQKKAAPTTCASVQATLRMLEQMIVPLLPPHIDLTVALPDGNMTVSCGEDHLMQIVMNLILNARDAMPNGGSILIDGAACLGSDLRRAWAQVCPNRHYVRLKVIDQGMGMSSDVIKKIFEPFFTTKPTGKGTGLGLSVVYGLVHQHGGHIHVTSQVGRGTCFTLYLPLQDGEGLASPSSAKKTVLAQKVNSSDHPAQEKGSLLAGRVAVVVEDEKELGMALSVYLESLGARVYVATHGDEALLRQDQVEGPIDVLLSDVRMPGLGGMALARLWHAVRPETKIIMMSGFPDEQKQDALPLAAFLAKPIDFGALGALLARVLADDLPNGPSPLFMEGLRAWERVPNNKTGDDET